MPAALRGMGRCLQAGAPLVSLGAANQHAHAHTFLPSYLADVTHAKPISTRLDEVEEQHSQGTQRPHDGEASDEEEVDTEEMVVAVGIVLIHVTLGQNLTGL